MSKFTPEEIRKMTMFSSREIGKILMIDGRLENNEKLRRAFHEKIDMEIEKRKMQNEDLVKKAYFDKLRKTSKPRQEEAKVEDSVTTIDVSDSIVEY